ncbi:E3 ubiquitin-protein ligase TRIM39 isoform X1 [Onychostoma macrolepis]|uniref:E3 ubiquitin-protein ligase TRIM39 isoform X1 n=1 Tax=Onychostoma macrolepis TaxID=369639 RepID=UPI002729C22F|nr:E3 ubiquitin-protein ligase TRIM39 isoform X1 [Onychostoma macrolepis]XP_058638339.1 E3 ubiquitin-protein ligase TRIM39 isoform X1 [Onychostoma macrolepis]
MPFSQSFLSEEQLLCSICLDVFDNPVSTPCGHNFCMTCIGHYWDSVKHCQCPLCKQTFKRKPDLHINRTLREITEQFKRMKENPGASGGHGAGRDAEERVRKHDSVDGTVRPGQLPGYLLEEMKRKLTGHRAHSNSLASHNEMGSEQTVTPNTESTSDTQPPGFARQVSLRRYTLSGAADAMKVPLCPKHHRNLELFCRSDLECICVECKQTGHQSHDITCAEKEWQSHKMKIGITETEIQEMTKERMQKVDEIKQSLVDIKIYDENLPSSLLLLPPVLQMLSEHEVQRSMQLFGAVISSLERRQAGLLEVTEINRRSAEHQAELMIRELEQEITELRRRSTALAKLARTENYVTGLKGYSDVSTPMSMKDWTGVSLTCDLGTKAIYTSVCQLLEQFKEELQKVPAVCLSVSANQSLVKSHPKVKSIQEYAVDVTLDTNTAHPRLILSEDKKKVWCGERHQQVPNSRERFNRVVCVLGCEGFTSGRRYWEVEVDGKTDWDLGVASHSCNRKGKITVSPSNGYWFLSLRDKNNYAFRTEPSTALALSLRPQKIGLFVDYEKGQVSFYNVDAKMHIYTFMDNFSETIYPFFSPCTNKTGKNDAPLVITPVLLD